jgi:hypothetical protein
MEYSSINIQGNIVSSEILDKIRNEDIKYQQPADFGLDRKTSVRDEIGLAWAATRAHYTAFKMRVDRLKEDESGASETRNSWMIPLLRELGYDVEKANAFVHPDTQKTYAISHKAANLGGFPIHIMGIRDDLDKRRENSGPRLSPHALTQEFLNNTDHTYALVTNGQFLRLLRDATRLVRLSYLEFDLVKMMEDELYADFAILFRLLHATRMPKHAEALEESYIEYYHQESLASGSRIREKLSKAVEASIKQLANGFLSHSANQQVRKHALSGFLKPDTFYKNQLRLIYRFLFLIVTEERNLVYPDSRDEAVQKKRKIYYDFYSIERLRRLAAKLHFVDGHKHDLWEGLKSTFLIFENGHYSQKLGIKPLGSGLFSPEAIRELQELKLSNEVLLRVIRYLTLFENDHKQWVRVNYSDLDVEEFGSVYEGLLEYDAVFTDVNGQPVFGFVQGKGRSSSGSHYTPEELVKPLIKHSLEYIIEDKLKETNPAEALLSIKVCDVACGSGHILLSAARRIAIELARVRTNEDQPTPPALRAAMRDVIRNCIYGVDKNELAVELCKVALWLEAHNPGEPLNFLDHHIKCGDSIVGLAHKEELQKGIADEAFKTLPGDEKEVAQAFSKRNKQERKTRDQITLNFEAQVSDKLDDITKAFADWNALPENTPEEVETKATTYKRLVHGEKLERLKTLADIQVGQFFIPKTTANKDKLVTDGLYNQILRGEKSIPQPALFATIEMHHCKFFHWFLEFPEVMMKGGFDCVLGNPPFLGGQKLSGSFGEAFLESIKYQFTPIGAVDLVTYFFRRIFTIIKPKGFQSLISTNTIAQGKAREDGLDVIVQLGGSINHAVKSTKWPGLAAVEVALVTITKQVWQGKYFLESIEVKNITPYLVDAATLGNPFSLKLNEGQSFQGHLVLSTGFMLEKQEATALMASNSKNKEVIFPFLNGNDLNSNPDCKANRYVIYFNELEIEDASKYLEPFKIVSERVFPERALKDRSKYPRMVNEWWKFWMNRQHLQTTINKLDKVLAVARVSKTLAFTFVDNNQIFDEKLIVFSGNSFSFLSTIQSTIHNIWAWQYCTTMKADLNYTPTNIFETFPFFQNLKREKEKQLESIGENYHEHRKQLMLDIQLGLTKTYNLFHSDALRAQAVNEKDKQVTSLQKHLANTSDTISFDESIQGILKLRELHVQMDEAVKEAYGWHDIQLRHDFYEVDNLPENDRVRYTIHPDARKEVLKSLLELNHQYYEEEIKLGLHKEADVRKYYEGKGIEVPAEVVAVMRKTGKLSRSKVPRSTNAERIKTDYDLFDNNSSEIN